MIKDLDSIKFADLQELKENSVCESKILEYKKELNLNNDSEKREFLSDISSFGNTSGGDIIYGVVEESGVPKSLDGIQIDDMDLFKQKIEGILRDNLEPRISGINLKEIFLKDKLYIFIIRIPKSWIAPHRVNYKGYNKFYARNTNGKYELDVSELRVAFNMADSITQKTKVFREERIWKIISKETPIPLEGERFAILHLVPLISLSNQQLYDIKTINLVNESTKPLLTSGWSTSYNFDGIISFDSSQTKTESYTQFFRNGIIEAVTTKLLYSIGPGIQVLPSTLFETMLFEALNSYFKIYKAINVDFPIFVFVSIVNYKDISLGVGEYISQAYNLHSIDRDLLAIPEVLVESNQIYFHKILRPIFDSLWNSCGFERCLHYDTDGGYNVK
jgi:hypothetical protein